MKKLFVILTILFVIGCVGCGDDKMIGGKHCPTYGLANKEEAKCKGVTYKIIGGNVFWAIVFSESIVAPLYFVLFDLYEAMD